MKKNKAIETFVVAIILFLIINSVVNINGLKDVCFTLFKFIAEIIELMWSIF